MATFVNILFILGFTSLVLGVVTKIRGKDEGKFVYAGWVCIVLILIFGWDVR